MIVTRSPLALALSLVLLACAEARPHEEGPTDSASQGADSGGGDLGIDTRERGDPGDVAQEPLGPDGSLDPDVDPVEDSSARDSLLVEDMAGDVAVDWDVASDADLDLHTDVDVWIDLDLSSDSDSTFDRDLLSLDPDADSTAGEPDVRVTDPTSDLRGDPEPQPGFYAVENVIGASGYVATFTVTYSIGDDDFAPTSGNFGAGSSRSIDVPADGVDIQIIAEAVGGRQIFNFSWSRPTTNCYRVFGTSDDTDYETADCADLE